jgi:hypothetical protein
MDSPSNFLSLTEAKSKELVPLIRGVPLHSLHNPRREAEVFANNHLAHLSKTANVLVLGLGFGYHIEEMSKILRLRHKEGRILVIEAHSELVRLWQSYQKNTCKSEVISATNVDELYANKDLCKFLLNKPVVIIHQASFESAKSFYQSFLTRRASSHLKDLKTSDVQWNAWIDSQGDRSLAEAKQDTSNYAAWLRAYWEFKHAE